MATTKHKPSKKHPWRTYGSVSNVVSAYSVDRRFDQCEPREVARAYLRAEGVKA